MSAATAWTYFIRTFYLTFHFCLVYNKGKTILLDTWALRLVDRRFQPYVFHQPNRKKGQPDGLLFFVCLRDDDIASSVSSLCEICGVAPIYGW